MNGKSEFDVSLQILGISDLPKIVDSDNGRIWIRAPTYP